MADTGLDIGTLAGRVTIEDQFSKTLDLLVGKIKEVDEQFGGLGARLAERTAEFFTAEAALDGVKEVAHLAAEGLKELANEAYDLAILGSHAADVEQTFDHLTASAGLVGEELLGTMRQGLRGTVTDMDLMTRVNQNLAVGLDLTVEQMSTLSRGAFALAKATGGDAAGALDKLSDAMVTGRIRGIQLLTGKIDLADAEQKFADKLGVATDHLTTEGKQAAIQEIILQRVADATERVGDQQTRLADKVQQAKTAWSNFEEELGTAIAMSPVINAGFDAIANALGNAFGDKTGSAIDNIVHLIENVSIVVVQASGSVVEAVKLIGDAVFALLPSFEKWLASMALVNLAASRLPVVGAMAKEMGTGLLQATIEIAKLNEKGADFDKTMTGMEDALHKGADAMKAASNSGFSFADAMKAERDAASAASAAESEHNYTVAKTAEELKKFKEAWANVNAAGTTWMETLQGLDPELVAHIKELLQAGVSASDLGTAYELLPPQIKAIELSLKDDTEQLKLHTKAMEEMQKLADELTVAELTASGSAADKRIADEQRWLDARVKTQKQAGILTEEMYAKDVQLAEETYGPGGAMDRVMLEHNEKTKAYAEAQARDAADAYTFAQQHADQFHQSDIEGYRRASEAAAQAAKNWDSTVGKELDDLNAKAGHLSENLTQAFEVTAANWNVAGLTGGGWGLMNDTIQGVSKNSLLPYLQAGFSLAKALIAVQANIPIDKWQGDRGPRVPGFAEGGVGDFGSGTLAMLHGKEAIVPLDKAGAGLGGSIIFHPGSFVFNYPIMNNPRSIDEFGRMISETVLARLRARGVRLG